MAYATVLASDLIAKFQYAVDNHWGYIWGTAGVLWTEKDQDKMDKTTSDTYEKARKYGRKWIGHTVSDCSGMFTWAFKELGSYMYHGSDTIWNQYTVKRGELVKGNRDDGVELKPGTAVFVHKTSGARRTHIGLFIGNGKVIEAAGTQAGVIISEVTNPKWAEWGELKYVAYSADEQSAMNIGTPTLRRGHKNANVAKLQELLKAAGCYNGDIDGAFGPQTDEAVRLFQRKNGLTVDGIVGAKTWAALEKIQPAGGSDEEKRYVATVPDLTKAQAETLKNMFPQAVFK